VRSDSKGDVGKHEIGHADPFDHPLLKRLSELAASVANARLIILSPDSSGWKEARLQSPAELPEFCRMVQSSKEGAHNCRLCHVLMTVAACTEGLTEQQCHAGARVLVAPAVQGTSGSLTVLSSCVFHSQKGMKAVRARAKALGIPAHKIEKAYRSLRSLSPKEYDALRRILDICAVVAKELQDVATLAAEDRRTADTKGRVPYLVAVTESRLRVGAPRGDAHGASSSALVRVLTQIIDERPHLPYTEKELAAAARITPNHLSLLFRRHTGKCFSDYLSDRRIELAKRLLSNLTLSIGDVARRSGYDDPSYFARRFRNRTGTTPRRWREVGAKA
jgi:AraC-like DNA-binding protein/ligand-binding sensor protein